MKIFKEIGPLRDHLKKEKVHGKSVGLVPTMGALHQGHLELVSHCKQQTDVSVASIYINPAQFNNANDLAKYPRDLDADFGKLETSGCDIVFCPGNEEMYTGVERTKLDFGILSSSLEGEFRPGHFNGVGLVVSKLLNIIHPQKAFFGQKDLQQFIVIREMAKDLSIDVDIVVVPTVRETDGLALSSRNRRLSEEERSVAPNIYEALLMVKDAIDNSAGDFKKDAVDYLSNAPGIDLEYLEVVDISSWTMANDIDPTRNYAVCISAFVGEVRLIDNILLEENVD